MPVNLISEEELRLALNSHRVDPKTFEAAVRERVREDAGREYAPLSTMSPLLQSAASLLPMEVFTAGQAGTAVKSTPIAGMLSKLFGFAAFPAISLFVLLGSAIFGAAKIRRIQNENTSGPNSGAPGSGTMDSQGLQEIAIRWWRDHRWGGWLFFAATLALSWFGATWLMFLCYIVSTLILVFILKSFASIGIGNRVVVGRSCMLGLVLLGQIAAIPRLRDHDIHLIDPMLYVPLFFIGAAVVSLVSTGRRTGTSSGSKRILWLVLLIVVAVWFMNPILWPATPARIRAYVESFDRAEFSSASWHEWETVASWAVKSKLAPDLSRPRRFLAEEIADGQDPALPAILDTALKVGLVRVDQVHQLKDYEKQFRSLMDAPISYRISPSYDDWVIRAAVLRNDLTPEQRDYLAKRLHENLRWSLTRKSPGTLNEPLRATQLLEVIGRPVNPAEYQEDIHALLRRFQIKTGSPFAGGFKAFDAENIRGADLNSTSDAIELMEFYGIPKDLDMNWVRSALRPSFLRFSPQKWIAAVTLDRLNLLPGVTRPSWFEILYYERSFLAAVILIGLCIYANVISPHLK